MACGNAERQYFDFIKLPVSYSRHCSTTRFGTFFKLLLTWRGSLYKLIYRELLVYLALYFSLSCIYRFALSGRQRRIFEDVSVFTERYSNFIPITFVLGFYVTVVVTRWWKMFATLPWPDRFAIMVASYVRGDNEQGRLFRRSLVRYLLAGSVITLRDVSSAVRKRFPSLMHLVDSGLLTQAELQVLLSHTNVTVFWIPIQWACNLMVQLREAGQIKSDYLLDRLIQEAMDFRGKLGGMINHDWLCIPLVYTQVVSIAVYTFFMVALMGRQYLDPARGLPGRDFDLYFPWFTTLQFIFYVGWLKVAETLMNPFGEDDDDFELNWLIDRNMKVGYLQVTEQFNYLPPLQKDKHWSDPDAELPQTQASLGMMDKEFYGSAVDIRVSQKQSKFLPKSVVAEYKQKHSTSSIVPSFLRASSQHSAHGAGSPKVSVTDASQNFLAQNVSLHANLQEKPMSPRRPVKPERRRTKPRAPGGPAVVHIEEEEGEESWNVEELVKQEYVSLEPAQLRFKSAVTQTAPQGGVTSRDVPRGQSGYDDVSRYNDQQVEQALRKISEESTETSGSEENGFVARQTAGGNSREQGEHGQIGNGSAVSPPPPQSPHPPPAKKYSGLAKPVRDFLKIYSK